MAPGVGEGGWDDLWSGYREKEGEWGEKNDASRRGIGRRGGRGEKAKKGLEGGEGGGMVRRRNFVL